MEEIGFIYVFALSVILLSAIFYTITDTTTQEKERATRLYLEDEVQRVAGVLHDVIDMQIIHPDTSYTRIFHLGQGDGVYNYRITFTSSRITLVSRYEDISTSLAIYNPMDLKIDARIQSDTKAVSMQYDPDLYEIVIVPVDPDILFYED